MTYEYDPYTLAMSCLNNSDTPNCDQNYAGEEDGSKDENRIKNNTTVSPIKSGILVMANKLSIK